MTVSMTAFIVRKKIRCLRQVVRLDCIYILLNYCQVRGFFIPVMCTQSTHIFDTRNQAIKSNNVVDAKQVMTYFASYLTICRQFISLLKITSP
jgi:hypothetical protein